MPRWAQSIRFRLSLAYALAVFTAGAVLVGGLYLWQVRQLNDPILMSGRRLLVENPATGELFDTQLRVYTRNEIDQAFLEQFEREAYREALNELRRASLAGLGVLFVVAFGSGWLLSGWTLKPMGKMAAVAREISGTELSRRIGLQGPDDELKDLGDTFDEMLDRLQASFEGQRRFIQDASHELRNPLAVTQTNLELVIDNPDAGPGELRDAARIAHASTGRLGQIIDDLVGQARREVPCSQLSMVDLDLMVAGVAAELQAGAAARELQLVVTGGGAVVHGDAAALRRAVTNLAVNAIRLAPAGTAIELTVAVDGGCALVSVADQGPGIAPEDQEAVFERFWRGRASGKGLGLGLSIVRQVAERHGGRVRLVSRLGRGSTFTIALPMPVARSAGL
jgi:signal transduction histidine kinase